VVDGRLLVALDDSLNNKTGRKIFGYGFFHDHTSKPNPSRHPWSQNIVTIGLSNPTEPAGRSGFKEIKQEIGSATSQTRNAHAVVNHLHFCMMAATITWIYADRIQADPPAPPRGQGMYRFRLLRCAKAHCRRRFVRGFSSTLACFSQSLAKFFRVPVVTHGGMKIRDLYSG